jgi:Bacterial PH domain/Short C-terminal domain
VRHLHNVIRSTEEVVELGQGRIGDKQGIVVLTTERLFFFERSMLGSESTQEFELSVIQALNVSKKLGGERIEVACSGTKAEITNMQHGQADSIVRAFHRLRRQGAVAPTPPSPTEVAALDPIEQIAKLAQLRDQGILTPEEFEAKRTDLLSRM